MIDAMVDTMVEELLSVRNLAMAALKRATPTPQHVSPKILEYGSTTLKH